jgi:hypothetical protein
MIDAREDLVRPTFALRLLSTTHARNPSCFDQMLCGADTHHSTHAAFRRKINIGTLGFDYLCTQSTNELNTQPCPEITSNPLIGPSAPSISPHVPSQ